MKQMAHCLKETLSKNPEYDKKRPKNVFQIANKPWWALSGVGVISE